MIHQSSIKYAALMLGLAFCMTRSASAAETQTSEHGIVGLFSPDREQDLRSVMADISEFELVHLDYDNARATFRYDVRALFPEMNPKKTPTSAEVEQRLSKLLSSASEGTFGLKPLPAVPREKLTKLELRVGILDCKGCRYAAYLAVTKVTGVEQATVGTDNVVTAWIDPTKADRAAVEDALKKARIEHVTAKDAETPNK